MSTEQIDPTMPDPTVTKKPKAPKAHKAKKEAKPKVPKVPGVIVTIKKLVSAKFMSKDEIVDELKAAFPKRTKEGMARTVQIQLSRIPNENKTFTVEKKKDTDGVLKYKLISK
jgi:hypothetical protein